MRSGMSLIFVLFAILSSVFADLQYIDANSTAEWGLSEACNTALTANISCDYSVGNIRKDVYYPRVSLDTVCTTACTSALSDYELSVKNACGSETWPSLDGDAPVYTLPGSLRFLYNMTCLEIDGVYCNKVFGEYANILDPSSTYIWDNTTEITNDTYSDCDDCFMANLQLQMNSPYFFDASLPDAYSSATSSCSKTNFPATTTTIAVGNGTQTATITTSTAAPTCTGTTYTIQESDDCHTISKSQGISTTWLILDNGLLAGCYNFPTSGDLCLVHKCDVYTVQEGDACRPIAMSNNITSAQIVSWNPELDLSCSRLDQHVGDQICISSPRGNYVRPPVVSATTTVAVVPTDAATGSNTRCATWYTAQSGDYCNLLTLKYAISLDDFLFLNPEINSNCTNLYADESYCMAAVGDINTYDGYQGYDPTPSTTGGPTSVWDDYPDSTFTPVPNNQTVWDAPLANGTRADCYYYINGDLNYGTNETVELAECDIIATGFGISLDDLAYFNPSLSSSADNCTFDAGFSYCVQLSSDDEDTAPTSGGLPGPSQSTNTRNGTLTVADGCIQYVTAVETDDVNGECAAILAYWGLTIAEFYSWNPAVGSDCSGLWLGSDYCVATNTSVPITTSSPASSATTATSTATSVQTSSPPGPTQANTISTCNAWSEPVAAGDTCASLEAQYGITAEQFLTWNPDVSADCQTNFWGTYSYCVGVQGDDSSGSSTTTPTATSSSGPGAPTMTGTVSYCNKWHTVVTGETCETLETTYGITKAQFLAWNPDVSSDCVTNFWLSEAYCVGVGAATAPAGTQAGIVSNCNAYMVTPDTGSTCSAIENYYGVTLAYLYSLNPAIGSDCTGLWNSEAYCVGTSS